MRIIFLDIDGVLNCEIFYSNLMIKKGRISAPEDNICPIRVGWLNELCAEIGAKVVISSSWKHSGLDYCKEVLKKCGATFDIIDITPNLGKNYTVRGNEILAWIKNNDKLLGINYYDYYDYVIIDDDSDMLYQQRHNFFQTDNYSGLTPTICYKIGRFFGQPRFKE